MKTVIDTKREWWPEIDQTISCICGAEFRGRHKLASDGDILKGIIDRPCPQCGDKCQVRGTSSDPEIWTLS